MDNNRDRGDVECQLPLKPIEFYAFISGFKVGFSSLPEEEANNLARKGKSHHLNFSYEGEGESSLVYGEKYQTQKIGLLGLLRLRCNWRKRGSSDAGHEHVRAGVFVVSSRIGIGTGYDGVLLIRALPWRKSLIIDELILWARGE